ncbi:solute:sodium symporter family transporter [Winogradskyella marincola]|uniref:Solute:sodium symporter family transporter n=1 Tax=Winogradskyella marincola TaxID=3037795 RepID=A0ABT6G472_9FLAO|nr:solute:sodium symporter family transporter [Winogradskyella sp. YYF002]MAB47465.1 solute:sodium symporter family transporter [Flavobacteriaceae bacterium]MBD09583.1 solute:sodium symporter family transporter [Flavobacteriaceae bacterium]MDG4716778.1 solute:sodium symporter family transporter [Winogradskyella sp. YYF002]|tara:strand:- start:2778 stop:4427 length:1650 start_codon:yes stop_codon:yes gene_type:complete
MQILAFIAFTLIVAIISYIKTRSTKESTLDGYFLGGRSLTAGVIAGSLLLTNLSTEQIVGLNGSAYQSGLSVMVWETLAAIAMVVTAIYLLPRYLKGGITTVPQFLQDRFDTSTKTITSALFLTGYVVVLLPIILYSGSIALSGMFDVPELLGVSKSTALKVCIWGIGMVGSVYAIFGGLKAVAVSDSINAIGLLIGGLLIPVFGLMLVGDGDVLNGLSILTTEHPDKFKSMGSRTDPVPFYTIFTGMMLVQLFYWGTNQQIIQRALGAKNLKEGQKGILLASFIKILGPLIVVLPGLIAFHVFNGDLGNGDDAYPMLVKKVLPGAWVGFFAAVLFGAILSSFNSVLNSSVTLFGMDIYKQHINKEASDKKVVMYGKIFGIVLALLAMFIAPLIEKAGSLFDYLQEVNGIYSIPILTIIVVGYFTKYVPAIAAKIGLVTGCVFYILSQFFLKPYFVEKALNEAKLNGNITSESALALVEAKAYPHFLDIMAILFVLNIIVMLIIGKLRPLKTPYNMRYTKQVDITPWKYVNHVSIGIALIVVAIYIYFA